MLSTIKRKMITATAMVLLVGGSLSAFAGCVTTTTTVTHRVLGIPVSSTTVTVTVCTS
jgi:hypothetical protein